MRRFVRLVSLVLGLTVFVGIAHAHHSQAGIFDSKKTIEVSGVIKSAFVAQPAWTDPPFREGRQRRGDGVGCRDGVDQHSAESRR